MSGAGVAGGGGWCCQPWFSVLVARCSTPASSLTRLSSCVVMACWSCGRLECRAAWSWGVGVGQDSGPAGGGRGGGSPGDDVGRARASSSCGSGASDLASSDTAAAMESAFVVGAPAVGCGDGCADVWGSELLGRGSVGAGSGPGAAVLRGVYAARGVASRRGLVASSRGIPWSPASWPPTRSTRNRAGSSSLLGFS